MLNWLSPYNWTGLWFKNCVKLAPLSHSVIQAAVLAALHNPTYSASVVDVEVVFCFRLDHDMAPPAKVKMYPWVDLRSEVSLA